MSTISIWQTLDVLMNAGVIMCATYDCDKNGIKYEVPQTTYHVFTSPDKETGVHTVVGSILAQTFVTLHQNKLIWRVPIRGVNKQGATIAWYRLRKTEYARLGKWPGITTEYVGKPREVVEETTDVEEAPVQEKRSVWNIFKKKE